MSDPVTRLNAALEGRYRIDRELGEGGMATVYLAEDLKHHRNVALKVLKPELAAVVGAERFLAEIETTAGLQHPHILPLFDSGEADGSVFYVMPHVEGESLRDWLDRETQLPVTDAVELARKVADALDYAHGRGVIHRDIKPANIMLSERGDPLVADFGIALAVSQAGGGCLTETGLSLGTPHYMSPEQALADRQVDPRSDVYSLGAMLYEMLAGAPPFAAPLAQAVLAKILTEDARPVDEHRKTVPAHVAAVVARSLEKLPADRFASAAEFQAALGDTHFEYQPRATAARRTTLPDSAVSRATWVGRGRRLLTGSVVVVLAITAAWGWLRTVPTPVSRYSVTLPDGQSFSSIIGSHLAIAPDGSTFVFSLDAGGPDQLWVRGRDELGATVLSGTTGARSPAYSPDGARLAFSRFGGGIEVISVSGGPSIPVAEGADDSALYDAGGHTLGPDGFIYAEGQGGIVRVSADGGTFGWCPADS